MLPTETLDQITRRFDYLEARLAEGVPPAELASVMREYTGLRPVAEAMAADPEMRALAEEEARALRDGLPAMEQALRRHRRAGGASRIARARVQGLVMRASCK